MLQGITIIIVVGINLGRYKKCAVSSLGMLKVQATQMSRACFGCYVGEK